MRINKINKAGFTLVEIMIVVLIIGILLSLSTTQRADCERPRHHH